MTELTTDATAYYQDGLRYDRVTSVCGLWPNPGLAAWRESVGKAVANRDLRHAQKVGSEVDALITRLLRGETAHRKASGVEVRQALRGFTEWHRLNPLTPVALQECLLDNARRLGGTPDCLTLDEGFDWKTSSRFAFSHVLQAQAYWELAASHDIRLQAYRLVRFDKILGTWEELVLTEVGITWQGQLLTRDFLSKCFETLLGLARQVRQVEGAEPVPV